VVGTLPPLIISVTPCVRAPALRCGGGSPGSERNPRHARLEGGGISETQVHGGPSVMFARPRNPPSGTRML